MQTFKDFYKKELLTEATIKRVTYDDFCSFLKILDNSCFLLKMLI